MTAKIADRTADATELLTLTLLPIARMMLKNGFGAGELVSAAKQASVRAALVEVIPPGGRVNISRLSVATGLTRKEIASLLGRKRNAKSLTSKPTLEQRAWRVLRGWNVDPRYRESSGRLAELPFSGKQRTFSSLVKRYGGDVTPLSVLRELERIGVITKARSGALRLHPRALHSRSLVTQQITDLARLFGDFAATVTSSGSESNSHRLFFGFRDAIVPSADQAALFNRTFAERGSILLESFDQWVKSQSRNTKKSPRLLNSKTRIGLGVYLAQDNLPVITEEQQASTKPGGLLPPIK